MAFSARCDRFLPGRLAEARQRDAARRLVGLALLGPFLFVAMAAPLLPPLGALHALAVVCSVFAAAWSVVIVVSTGRTGIAAALALCIGAPALALLVAASGGLASPAALLLVAFPIEAWWIGRDRRSLAVGLAAMALAGLAQPAMADLLLLEPPAASGWDWLAPAILAVAMAARWRPVPRAPPADTAPLSSLENGLQAAVLRLDWNGEIQECSGWTGQILGMPPDLLIGQNLRERVRTCDRAGFGKAMADIRKGASSARLEPWLRLPVDGGGSEARPFDAELVNVGEGVVAVVRPAFELTSLRERLADLEQDTDASDIARARFLASVSHELRTPLNAIIGFSDLMLQEAISGPLAPKQKEHLGLIRDAGRHLLSVVNAILDVSKIESGAYRLHPEPFRVRPAVAFCQSILAVQAEQKGIELRVLVEEGLEAVSCDQRAVQQIIINLLSNAIKFTAEGGAVELSAGIAECGLRLRVSDNGIGMTAADIERIGRPFTQIANDYTRDHEGTGLGLSLVRGLVDLHGGGLSIESEPGKGTTVTVTLPQRTGEAIAFPPTPPAAQEFDEVEDETVRQIA